MWCGPRGKTVLWYCLRFILFGTAVFLAATSLLIHTWRAKYSHHGKGWAIVLSMLLQLLLRFLFLLLVPLFCLLVSCCHCGCL